MFNHAIITVIDSPFHQLFKATSWQEITSGHCEGEVSLAPINYKLIHIHKLKGFSIFFSFCILPLFGPGILVPKVFKPDPVQDSDSGF